MPGETRLDDPAKKKRFNIVDYLYLTYILKLLPTYQCRYSSMVAKIASI